MNADDIRRIVAESVALKERFFTASAPLLLEVGRRLGESLLAGGRVLAFGNGGSAADAQHFVAELVGRFQRERAGLSAIALTTDTSVLTSIANDYAFDEIFSKQVKARGKKGDVALGITTSGSSGNVLKALRAAKKLGMTTIALTGEGGKAASLSDIALQIPSRSTPRIQEAHIAVGHILCDLTDTILFKDVGKR